MAEDTVTRAWQSEASSHVSQEQRVAREVTGWERGLSQTEGVWTFPLRAAESQGSGFGRRGFFHGS